jgi:hypothetical protein
VQKTASATQPQLCPIGTYIDDVGAASTQSCKFCPDPQDCTVAGKTAPDCTPTVWRPSTFWCYEIRDQAIIIASALFTAITSIYGGIAFYNRFTVGRQRLSTLGVDLKHLKKVVEVIATAFLIDKVISLHKRKEDITVKTLWRDIPFDKDMDKDVDTLIIARIDRLFTDLQARGDPLSLDNLALFVRAHVQAGDTIIQQQPRGSSDNDNGSHPVGAPCSSAVLALGSSEQTTICSPLNEVVVHKNRNVPLQAPRMKHTRSPSPGEHSSNSTPLLSCAIWKRMCSSTIVILFCSTQERQQSCCCCRLLECSSLDKTWHVH